MGERLTLKQMVLNEIDNQSRGYAEILAPIAGYASGSNLKKVLRNEEKEFENFNGLVSLVRFLFPEDELKLMEEYSKTLDPCNKSARCMLEYLSCNRLLDAMKELIDKMLECKNKESMEWAKVYSIQYNWQLNYYNLEISSFLNTIIDTKTTLTETRIFLNLLRFYGYYKNQNYRMAYEVSKCIEIEINKIKEVFIKNMYLGKLNEALSYIKLRVLNKPEDSRKRSELVIDAKIGLAFESYAHYSIGCSYLFTSYENAMKHLIKSAELYESVGRSNVVNDIKEKIDLLNILWDKSENVYTITAKLLQEALLGNLKDKDLSVFKDEVETPYLLLIKGIQLNNNDLLLQSVIEFLRIGDTFMANIPRIELLKRNYNEDTLNMLISLNQPA